MVSDGKKSLDVMVLVKSPKFFLFMPTWSLASMEISNYGFYFISIFLSSNQKNKKIIIIIKKKKILKKVAVLAFRRIFCTFSCFFHTILVKFWNYLLLTNIYYLTWSIYTSHGFLEIKNLVFFKLLKKVLPSNTNIFVICSVKYHFTEVMTTNLEKKIDFFSEDTLCYISDTKSFQILWKSFFDIDVTTFSNRLNTLSNTRIGIYSDSQDLESWKFTLW